VKLLTRAEPHSLLLRLSNGTRTRTQNFGLEAKVCQFFTREAYFGRLEKLEICGLLCFQEVFLTAVPAAAETSRRMGLGDVFLSRGSRAKAEEKGLSSKMEMSPEGKQQVILVILRML
jgi:hypothetical protein